VKRPLFINLLISVAISIFIIFLYYIKPQILEDFEHHTYDMRFRLRGSTTPSPDIAIIAIDEKSIESIGRFPWSRKYHARLLDIAKESGAKAVLFDIFFSEGESPEADSLFSEAIRKTENVSVPLYIEFKDGLPIRVNENIPEIESVLKEECHINISPDTDGVVRWNQLIISFNDKRYPSLGLVGALRVLGIDSFETQGDRVILGSKEIPVNNHSGQIKMLINYSGPEGTFERYSYSDVISGSIGREKLAGKVLFVGATAPGLYDLRVTPFSNNMPGVELNANVANNIVEGNFIEAGPFEALLDIVFVITISLLVSVIVFRTKAVVAVPVLIVLLMSYIYLSYIFFLSGRWISIVYPLIGAIGAFSASSSLRFFVVEKKAREIKAIFSNYVSKKVVEELLKNPQKAKIGGQRKTLTVMFADIRGYTSLSERHEPEEIVKMLNEFFSEMTEIIIQHDGTIDKFLGDGILAFWGAPIEEPRHAELAVRCSIKMLERMERLKEKWLSEGKEPIDIGIGLNTGVAVVGNIGVEGRKMEYTAIGDTVNIAHRLQILSRGSKRPVISEALYKEVKDLIEAEYLGEIAIKGKELTTRIYAVMGLRH